MRQIILLALATIYVGYELDNMFLKGQFTKEVRWYVFRTV